MPKKSAYLILLLLLPLFLSCKKNRDKEQPYIRIDTPLSHSVVMAGNTVRVTGGVSDNQKLQSVTIKILSVDGHTQLAEPVSLPITGKEMTIDRGITVGDIHTEAGAYQVVVEASDGTNRNKEYVDITVNEIPRVFKKLVVVRKSGTGYALDSLTGSGFHTFFTRPEDVSTAEISQYHQLIYVAGRTQGSLMGYNLLTKQVAWNVPADAAVSGSPLFFTHVYDPEARVLWQSMAGSTANTLRSITANGSAQKTIQVQAAHYAGAVHVTASNIVVGEHPLAGSGSPMLSYYYSTGFGLEFTTAMPLNAVKIFSLSNHELAIFGNSATQGEMRIYNRNTNGFWEQVNLPAGRVYDAVQLSSNNYIIAHEQGLIRFEHSTSNMIVIAPGQQAQALQLDAYSGTLYAGVGNSLKTFHPVTGAELGSFPAADSVKAILPHYNK